jgi:predicted house-cleaning noncanonical NTP pyrophosphatase (MazG superfamily)
VGAKLVRDRMGDIPWQDEGAKKYLRPVKDAIEHFNLLHLKLMEEVGELMIAESPSAMAEELGDIYEVLDAMVAFVNEDLGQPGSVREIVRRKHAERGGFTEGLVFDMRHYQLGAPKEEV